MFPFPKKNHLHTVQQKIIENVHRYHPPTQYILEFEEIVTEIYINIQKKLLKLNEKNI